MSKKRKIINVVDQIVQQLYTDIARYIEDARQRVAAGISYEMVQLYWQIGKRINQDLLKEKRAEYGKQIVESVSTKLLTYYGRGFGRSNLFHMVRFVEVFPDWKIIETACGVVKWSHLREIIYIKDDLKREFYLEMCRIEKWSVRILQEKLQGMLYERTAISQKPEKLIREELEALRKKDSLTPDFVFKDPYLLDFLGLHDSYSEKDLENEILHKLEKFLLELGSEFAFIGRQKRITLDNDDYYIDLLFYHRGLCALVVIDLKLGKFKPADKGQMELYLKYLEKYEKKANENLPLGLILCAEKSKEVVEIMSLEQDRIKVAEYLTRLPAKEIFRQKLHNAMTEAHKEFEQQVAYKSFPVLAAPEDIPRVKLEEVKILKGCQCLWLNTKEIARQSGIGKMHVLRKHMKALLAKGLLEYKHPKSPRHPKQKYRTTEKGKTILEQTQT